MVKRKRIESFNFPEGLIFQNKFKIGKRLGGGWESESACPAVHFAVHLVVLGWRRHLEKASARPRELEDWNGKRYMKWNSQNGQMSCPKWFWSSAGSWLVREHPAVFMFSSKHVLNNYRPAQPIRGDLDKTKNHFSIKVCGEGTCLKTCFRMLQSFKHVKNIPGTF